MNDTRGFIAACEREALHLSGAIQPHGALVVADAGRRVTHASVNLAHWIGVDARVLIGQALPGVLDEAAAGLGPKAGDRLLLNAVQGLREGVALEAVRGDHGESILAMLPAAGSHREASARASARGPLRIAFDDEAAVAAGREALVSELLAASGFDRVLVYRFLPGGDGEVLAEACGERVEGSYLGLRFPASDVPQVARAIYLRNPWRTIPDATAASVDVVGADPTPPDLTLIDLRSVSPVHRIYMGNMGVAGAISFPLVAAGELAGLVSLHSSEPRRLSPPLLYAIADRVKRFEWAEREFQVSFRMRLVDSLERRFAQMRQRVLELGGLESAWAELSRWLIEEFEADGAMIDDGHRLFAGGLALEPHAIRAVDAWCRGEGVVTRISESLVRDCPGMPLSEVAGLLACSALQPDGQRIHVYLCRAEEVHQVAWGGNPDKPPEQLSGELPIAPRRSFERWIEERLGYSRPWPGYVNLKLLKLRLLIAGT